MAVGTPPHQHTPTAPPGRDSPRTLKRRLGWPPVSAAEPIRVRGYSPRLGCYGAGARRAARWLPRRPAASAAAAACARRRRVPLRAGCKRRWGGRGTCVERCLCVAATPR
eukprot:scaffold370_cov289-Prasinococcus_capsulatus_cf.AAC.15